MIEVLRICVPLFAMIAFGVALRRSGMLNDAAEGFLSRFVYLFSLPVLIFLGVSANDVGTLLNWAVIATTLPPAFALAGLFWALGRRLPRTLRGPVALSPFFGNLAYIGFPLAYGAFGQEGLVYAAIINAFALPVFVMLGVFLLTTGETAPQSRARLLRTAVLNPMVGAVVAGLAASALIHDAGLGAAVGGVAWLRGLVMVATTTLRTVGDMGLPMALLAVGAALRFEELSGRLGLTALCTAAKLVLMPAASLLLCAVLFPSMPVAARGTTVLLMASPLSVGCYVISRELETDSRFIAGLLVATTVGACVTIPGWVAALV